MDRLRGTALLAAAQRAARTPRARVAVALHLSRLPTPGPRPYHRRIALAVLKETAQHHDGEVFLLAGGDAVLLCLQHQVSPAGPRIADPDGLPHIMARLFRADTPPGTGLTTVWALERESEALLSFATQAAA